MSCCSCTWRRERRVVERNPNCDACGACWGMNKKGVGDETAKRRSPPRQLCCVVHWHQLQRRRYIIGAGVVAMKAGVTARGCWSTPATRKPSGFAALPQGESNFVGFPRCTKKNCSNTSSASSIEGDDSRPRLVRRRGWRNPGRRDEDEENSGQRTMYVMFPTSGPRRLTTVPKPHDGGAGDRMGL